jgi:hypothetical protein
MITNSSTIYENKRQTFFKYFVFDNLQAHLELLSVKLLILRIQMLSIFVVRMLFLKTHLQKI